MTVWSVSQVISLHPNRNTFYRAGLRDDKIVEAHGTFSAAACSNCKAPYDTEMLRDKIMMDEDPVCPHCGGWVKPNIVFFGEQLPQRFFDEAEMDCTFSDLLICIGTSLEVYPFAGINGHELLKH